jgi:hypothetical protein
MNTQKYQNSVYAKVAVLYNSQVFLRLCFNTWSFYFLIFHEFFFCNKNFINSLCFIWFDINNFCFYYVPPQIRYV